MDAPWHSRDGKRTPLAIVHHANQYVITNGYYDRQGMGDILGLGEPIVQSHLHRRGLLPLLQMHLEYRVPLNLHVSGTLIETLLWHYPQCLAQLKRLRRAGLVELVGSTFSQNVMPFFSDEYNLRQMNEELWFYRRHLGWDLREVKTFWVPERVWDTQRLARVLRSRRLLNGGYQTILLDDRMLYPVGRDYTGSPRERFDREGATELEAYMPWRVEGGDGLVVMPISKRLRYAVPPSDQQSWHSLRSLLGWLAESGDDRVVAVYGDDLERAAGVGGWDPQHAARYEDFLRWLGENRWVEPVLVGEWLAGRRPTESRPVERGTFYELAQAWRAGEDYRGWYEDPNCQEHRQFLATSEQALAEAERQGGERGLIELGWAHLLHSSYETSWHNRAEETPGPHHGRDQWLAPWAAALTSHARSCVVIAEAALWFKQRDGRAHAELRDVDGDGEQELVLKNDKLYAVFSPTRGGRLVYLFDLTGSKGRLVVGNISDDWNLQEELNRYMDQPRNHPGAFADVGFEHDRYDVASIEEGEGGVTVTLYNVQEGGALHGAQKRVTLAAGGRQLCVDYMLPPWVPRISTEVCLSPDYRLLLRQGRKHLASCGGKDWRGWKNGATTGWVRLDTRQSTVWDVPYQPECGHGMNLRVTSFAKSFHLELGVGAPSAQECAARSRGVRRVGVAQRAGDAWQPPPQPAAGDHPTPHRLAQRTPEPTLSAVPAGREAARPADQSSPAPARRPRLARADTNTSGAVRARRQMQLVTDPHFMRRYLARNLSSLSLHGLDVEACRLRVLRPHHHKLTIEYNLQIGSPKCPSFSHTLVGTWREDVRNLQLHHLLSALWQSGFADPGDLTIARPVAYSPKLHLRLRERVAGKLLKEWLYQPEADWEPPLRRVAAWLGRLHDTRIEVARRFDPAKEARLLRGWQRDLLACEGGWISGERPRLGQLVNELIARVAEGMPGEVCLTHGDFHPENIFLRGKTVTVIDFEQSAMADPASDLGYLIAEIDVQAERNAQKRGFRNALDIDRLTAILLESYGRRRPKFDPRWVPFHMARTYLKHLVHTVRMKGSDNPQHVARWLDKAAACLAQCGGAKAQRGRRRRALVGL